MRGVCNRQRRSAGFTLAEVLATVAIIAILLGIALPSAVAIQRDLRLNELDASASAIFAAAQNRLTALRAADGLNAVIPPANQKALIPDRDADGLPLDTVSESDTVGYVTQADEGILRTLLPGGSVDPTVIENMKGLIIEYNAFSGSVNGVYYAEAEFAYTEDLALQNSWEARRKNDPLVGYYGGDSAGRPQTSLIEAPKIDVENGEELRLVIDNSALAADPDYKILQNISYTVTLTQADDVGRSKTLLLNCLLTDPENALLKPGEENPDRLFLVLDSLEGGKHFADVAYQDDTTKQIQPGADVIVTVTLEYDGEEGYAVPYQWTKTVNSLFAESGWGQKPAGGQAAGTEPAAAKIAYGRQLQNLAPEVSGLADGYAPEKAEQTKPIDWAYYNGKKITSPGGYSLDENGNPKELFETFGEGTLLSIYNGKLREYNGANNEIYNLSCVPNAITPVYQDGKSAYYGAGLFAGMKKGALRQITLVNARARGAADQKTVCGGTLAGYTENTSITECAVYFQKTELPETVGKPDLYTSYGVFLGQSGTADWIGGMVGWMNGGTAEKSFASQPRLTGGSLAFAGGFAGKISGQTQLSECYADTGLISGMSFSGGFAQTAESQWVRFANCYAVSRQQTDSAAGFANSTNGYTAANCYAAAAYSDPAGTAQDKIARTGFGPKAGGYEGCYYLTEAVDGPKPAAEEPAGVAPVAYKKLHDWIGDFGTEGLWTANTTETSHPYAMDKTLTDDQQKQLDSALLTKLNATETYPFPRLAAFDHHGDWPLPAKGGAFVYYEVYEDGAVGMEGVRLNGTAFDTTHKLQNGKLVTRDGYAYADGADEALLTSGTISITVKKDETLSTKAGITVCPLAYADLAGQFAHSNTFYRQVTVNGNAADVYFNPHFAKSVVYADKTAPAQPETVSVRSARQLAALGSLGQNGHYWALSFAQELNIDFSLYDRQYTGGEAPALSPVGTSDDAFSGVYDGGGHTITGAGLASGSAYVGLFGYSTGTLQNIVFRDPGAAIRATGDNPFVGALAGYNGGSIDNCAVAGFTVDGKNVSGGLAGVNSGTITNSAASCKLVNGTHQAGGLVGQNNGTVNACYALGEVTGGAAGALCGQGTAQNSYAACSVGGTMAYIAPDGSAASWQELAGLVNDGNRAAQTYPYTSTGAYPFPAVVKDAAGRYVHYGDWPENPQSEAGESAVGVMVLVSANGDTATYKMIGGKEQEDGSYTVVSTEITVTGKNFPKVVYFIDPPSTQPSKWYVWKQGDWGPVSMQNFNKFKDFDYSHFQLFTKYTDKTDLYFYYDTYGAPTGTVPTGWVFKIPAADIPNP
ncbi:MAG: type II secretion system protein [Eubacteriales bacterium]|nr:type II secretion system protein [Eubacteriales bacterium]